MIKRYNEFINESNKPDNINKIIDFTVIKPNTTKEDIVAAIETIRNNHYYGIVIKPEFIDFVNYELTEEDNIKIIAIIDFPDGLMKYEKKLSEVIDAISNGVEEIDLTINVEEIKEIYKNENEEEKEKEYNVIVEDIKMIADECHKNGVILKLIIETGILSLTELIDVCNIVYKAGIDFIQTSTGMKGNGAELSKLKELRRLLPEYVKIKASGGIRTIEDAKKMLPYVDRIGTSVVLT